MYRLRPQRLIVSSKIQQASSHVSRAVIRKTERILILRATSRGTAGPREGPPL